MKEVIIGSQSFPQIIPAFDLSLNGLFVYDCAIYCNHKMDHLPSNFRITYENVHSANFLNGYLHNDSGPAIIYMDSSEDWYLNGVDITTKVNNWKKENNLLSWKEWDNNIWVLFRLKFS